MFEGGYTGADHLHAVRVYDRERNREREKREKQEWGILVYRDAKEGFF
jgi:hypothetical protein